MMISELKSYSVLNVSVVEMRFKIRNQKFVYLITLGFLALATCQFFHNKEPHSVNCGIIPTNAFGK